MQITLLDQINQAEKTRREVAQRLVEQEVMIAELKLYRFQCKHNFVPAIKGYEYAGGHCTKCGINKIFWDYNKGVKE